MRTAFIDTLFKLAKQDERIFLLTADLGFSVFEKFQSQFPKRFLNVGVAEQNMVGIAAGLALSKKIPFVYSIVPFLTLKALEQIRNDICYHHLNVKLIGVGGGFSYGVNGCTHYSLEDIAIMKSLPTMQIICPGDPLEVRGAIQEIIKIQSPCYIRLGKSGEPIIHKNPISFKIGKALTLKEGTDITLISTGNMLENSMLASELLEQKGIRVRLISMHTLKPIDSDIIIKAASETKAIATIEEHSEVGGLSSSVADILTHHVRKFIPLKKIAVLDTFSKKIGDQHYLREQFGLSKEKIASSILEFIQHEHSHHRSIIGDWQRNHQTSP